MDAKTHAMIERVIRIAVILMAVVVGYAIVGSIAQSC